MAARRRARWQAAAVIAGAGLSLAAGVLIVWPAVGVSPATVYTALVPAALVALLLGAGGLRTWLWGEGAAGGLSKRPGGLSKALLAMSTRRHEALDAVDGRDDGPRPPQRWTGIGAMRVGGAVVVVASLLLQGQVGELRSLLFLGWLVFFAGAGWLGMSAIAVDAVPRAAGVLVLAGSLLMLSPITVMLNGTTRRPETLGPLLPSLMPWLAMTLWLSLGAGLAWLGVGMWSARTRD